MLKRFLGSFKVYQKLKPHTGHEIITRNWCLLDAYMVMCNINSSMFISCINSKIHVLTKNFQTFPLTRELSV